MLTDVDSFHTVNHFYGLQLGSGVDWEGKWIYVDAFGKVAVGVTDQEVDITGSTTRQSSWNAGGRRRHPRPAEQHRATTPATVLGCVPEGGINFGVKVKPCLRLTAGYSFLYWNSVVRPAPRSTPP